MGMHMTISVIVGFNSMPSGDDGQKLDDLLWEDPIVNGRQVQPFGNSEYWGIALCESDRYCGFENPIEIDASFMSLVDSVKADLIKFCLDNEINQTKPGLFLVTTWG